LIREELAGLPAAQRSLLLPHFQTVETAEMQHIVLRIGQLDGIGGDFLLTDRTTDNRAGLLVGTLRHQASRRGAMLGIHSVFLKTLECSAV